ncbi:MAG: ParB/RepB/Spo0J family partition protein [Alphaproteobacteria bacterium]|nr:ParB/RepB/Spo0J family partition protein [Alphaproteobacteria bacterium]MBU1514975.1 ParB/RepB/Spo0J family partition protein [Alphaproteobacteria bacterium]MBU2095588.1 ParB/RepB/Spo0J family partition protein [Alphaproteobacteria bacterium]MBU2149726.1 ParB/RepB/Spo0J family partition protein [Alphaproteobacteria bacterium]MBU2309049.1 ParB/RepB/Spo0J family partition protein [Alphaproteobacteria bacterium]
MAENRRGLGRGLSALLGESEEIAHASDPASGVRDIPIELIHRNPEQPRQNFDEADLAELEASIRDKGVLQPILVRPSPGKDGEYEIVAGERRWRAAQRAGLRAIPALVRTLGDTEAFEIAIIENIQRADLNAIEEARAYSALMGRLSITQDETAKRLGKSRSHVANTLRLMQLPPGVQDHLVARRLTAGHARALLTADNAEALADRVVAEGLSVRETEALTRDKADAPKKASGPRKAPKDADTASLEVDLEDALGMSVDITDRDGVGEVKIKYASLEQLDEICRRLMRS